MQVQRCSSGCQRQVIFAPYLADSVGIFDPAGESCHLGTQMSSDFKLNGAAPAASGRSSSPPYLSSGEEYCRVNILPTDIISKVLARLGRDLGSHCLPEVLLPNGELLTELESATFAPFFSDQESLQGQAETLPEPLVPPTPAQHALMPEEGLAPRSC